MGLYNTHILPFLMGIANRIFYGVGFNGTTQRGVIDHAPEVHPPALTLSLRCRFTTTANLIVMEKSSNNTAYLVHTTAGASDRVGSLTFGIDGTNAVRTPKLNDGQWHSALFTYQHVSGSHNLVSYADGGLHMQTTTPGTASPPNANPWHVASRNGATLFCPIDLAELAMWSRALTQAQSIAAGETLKRIAQGLEPVPADLVFYYPDAPVQVTGQAWTHEWVDIVSGRVMKLYNSPSTPSYER